MDWYARDQGCIAVTPTYLLCLLSLSCLQSTQSGSLPSDIASVVSLTEYSGLLDTRLNFMCCCGVGPLIRARNTSGGNADDNRCVCKREWENGRIAAV